MKISEIFYSIQGEGSLVGVPSVFIRTSGCNLRCSWCDTPYTSWQPEGADMSLDDILAATEQYPARHAVVTGGEPMIAPDIVSLTHLLLAKGLHITVETAGTVHAPVACSLMSLSPKLANSTPEGHWAAQHNRLRYQPEILRRLMNEYEYQVKFVVSLPGDLDEIEQVIGETGAAREKVVLMPEGTDAAILRERGVWVAEACKREGFRYTPRLHVDLYGHKRGV